MILLHPLISWLSWPIRKYMLTHRRPKGGIIIGLTTLAIINVVVLTTKVVIKEEGTTMADDIIISNNNIRTLEDVGSLQQVDAFLEILGAIIQDVVTRQEDLVALFTEEDPQDNALQTIQDEQFLNKDILQHQTICNNTITNAPTEKGPTLVS